MGLNQSMLNKQTEIEDVLNNKTKPKNVKTTKELTEYKQKQTNYEHNFEHLFMLLNKSKDIYEYEIT